MRSQAVLPHLAAMSLLIGACSFLIDTSLEDGFPCQEEEPRCLEGFLCLGGICVADSDDPSFDPCEGTCGDLERCDRSTATCVPICEGVVCGTGDVCLDTVGGCTPIIGGLGQICTRASDCEGLLDGCSTDPGSTSRIYCGCVVPAPTAKRGDFQGVCIGIPRDPTDCAACGEARCIRPKLSSAGLAGAAATRAICVSRNLGTCGGDEDCHGSESHTVCTYFGWPLDPETAGWPEGIFSACATPAWGAPLGYGDECQAEDPLECETGLCVPVAQGRHRCTSPCDRAGHCSGSMSSCVDAVVHLGRPADSLLWDVAQVCGQGPTLGEVCEPGDPLLSSCATDAPWCLPGVTGEEHCSRDCRKDSDCGEGFACRIDGDYCIKTGE